MGKIINFFKRLFSKGNNIEILFPENKKAVLAEVGGNYCSDCC